jgi:hypothetical protein
MRISHALIGIALVFLTGSCYGEISDRVLDAETGQPIEGAVVLVQWTVTKGMPGITYNEVYKIIEEETDKNGRFTISGIYNPLVNPPYIVIYKAGFVAWRNDFIFPGWEKRTDFKYENGLVIKLEKFKEGFSYEEHHGFMDLGIIGASLERTPKFNKALSIELSKALRQIENKKRKNN